MTVIEAGREFDAAVEKEGLLESPSILLERIKNQISWLEYVEDREYSEEERKNLCEAARRFYLVIRPLTSKFID